MCLFSIHASDIKRILNHIYHIENEDVVGAVPTGNVPTTSEWSTILLPTKVQLIWEVWWYIPFSFGHQHDFRSSCKFPWWQHDIQCFPCYWHFVRGICLNSICLILCTFIAKKYVMSILMYSLFALINIQQFLAICCNFLHIDVTQIILG